MLYAVASSDSLAFTAFQREVSKSNLLSALEEAEGAPAARANATQTSSLKIPRGAPPQDSFPVSL
jgi:hypothetical protein